MPCATSLPSALCLALGKVNLYRVPVVWHSAKLETLGICEFSGSGCAATAIELTHSSVGMDKPEKC